LELQNYNAHFSVKGLNQTAIKKQQQKTNKQKQGTS